MAILWAGGEDESFPNGSVPYINTGGTTFRSGYARCSIGTDAAGKLIQSTVFAGGEITDGWYTFRYCWNYLTAGERRFGLCKSGTSGRGIYFGLKDADNTRLAIHSWDGSTQTQLAAETGTSADGSLHKVDIHLTGYGTGTVTITVYLDGVQIISYSGALAISGVNGFDQICAYSSFGSSHSYTYSEIVVSDADTRTLSLVTHYETGTGDVDDWEGAYTDIDEITINDADLISTPTADEDFQAAMSDVPAGSFIVPAIVVKARATKSIEGSAVGTLKLGVKSGGTIDVDAGHALTTSWATYERIAATINGGAMTTALLDAMQLDLRSAA